MLAEVVQVNSLTTLAIDEFGLPSRLIDFLKDIGILMPPPIERDFMCRHHRSGHEFFVWLPASAQVKLEFAKLFDYDT